MEKRIILLAALASLAFACGDDGESEPPPDDIKVDGAINPNVDASVPSIDSGLGNDGSVSGDGSTPPVKTGAPGCFQGTPSTSVQFLNACADGFREFDNTKRIPGFVKGQLPPL